MPGIVAHAFQFARLVGDAQVFGQVARDVAFLVDGKELEIIVGELFVEDLAAIEGFEEKHHFARGGDIFAAFAGGFQVHHFAAEAGVGQSE